MLGTLNEISGCAFNLLKFYAQICGYVHVWISYSWFLGYLKILKEICNPKKFQTTDLVEKTNHLLTTMDHVINKKIKVWVGLNMMCMW